jgi:hypothetical protein
VSWQTAPHGFTTQRDFLMGAIEFCAHTDAAVHAVDGPAAGVNRRLLGKGNDVQHGGANMLGAMLWKRDS